MKGKLRLVKVNKLKYVVPLPERMNHLQESKIKIRWRAGEYQYIPRYHTFVSDVTLTSDELDMISEEVKRLNKNS